VLENSPVMPQQQDQSGPRCVFVFCDKAGGALPFANERVRKLPAGLFSRLLTKAARWSQFTSGASPLLARTCATLTFGTQLFELRVDFQKRAFCFTACEGSCHFPLGVVMSLKGMLDEILEQVFPLLRCAIGVSAAGASSVTDPVDLMQLQAATESLTRDDTAVMLDGVKRSLAPLAPWLALDDPAPTAGFDIFLSFHDADAAFAGKLADSIGRHAIQAGRGRVRVFPSFKEGREERLKGLARSRIFVPIVSSACLQRWHHEMQPMTVIQLFVLACALGTVVHVAADVVFTMSVAPGSMCYGDCQPSLARFTAMVLTLVLPYGVQARAVSATVKAEAASSSEFRDWHARHAGVFPVFFLLGCVRPDLMVSLMRCRAFGWDVFDAPLTMGARTFLTSSALVSTVLSDFPQLVVMWTAHRTSVQWVAMGFGVASVMYALASRWSALLFFSAASARGRHRRPTQRWGRDEVDPLLLEWIVALDVCHSNARGGSMSYDRYRKEGLRALRKVTQHDVALIVPVVIDKIGVKGGDGRVFTDLSFDIHRQVPTATAGEGTQLLQNLFGIEPDSASAVRNTLRDTVLRMLAHGDTIDESSDLDTEPGQLRESHHDVWAVYERLAGYLVHKIGRLHTRSS
jgi:hypothetical protein